MTKLPIRVFLAITIGAVSYTHLVERTGNNTKVWVGGLLDGHDLKHLEKLETSDIPKEKRLEVWYKAERTYCDYCIYSIICKERSLPCIICLLYTSQAAD